MRSDEAVLRALTVAGEEKTTLAARLRQFVPLVLSKLPLFVRAYQFGHGRLQDVSQQVIWLNEVIAGIQIAVVFQRQGQAAGACEDADRSCPAKPARQRRIKVKDEGVANVSVYPLVEDLDEVSSPLARPDGAVRDRAAFLESGLVVPLNNGDELDVSGIKFIAKEAVHVEGIISVFRIDGAQDVELDLMLLQQPDGSLSQAKSPMTGLVFAIEVMKLPGAVDTQADEEIVLEKEMAPLVGQKDSVGLEGVLNPRAGLCVLLLDLHGALIEIQAHECGLSALPRHGHQRTSMAFKKLFDISLMHLIGHAEIAFRIKLLLFQIEAIVATEIACRAGGRCHHVKRGR